MTDMVTPDHSRADWKLPWALLLVVFVTRLAFVYGGGMPEPDSVVMAAGMAKGLSPGVGLGDATLYGRQLSPAMYAFVDAVYPVLFDSPRHLVTFLNWLTVIAASLLVLPLMSILRRHMPTHAAVGTVLIAFFSPLIWEWGTYFHPLVLSVLFLLLSITSASRVSARATGVFWFVATLLCAAIALVIRAEVLFVVPAIVIWSFVYPPRRARNVSVAVAAVVAAGACYLLVLRMVPAAKETEAHNLSSYATMIYKMYIGSFSLSGLTRSVTWAVLSIGVATIAASALGLARYLVSLRDARRRTWDNGHALVIGALAWLLPTLVFWLPQPTPIMRHYVLPAFAIAWLVGYLVLKPMGGRRAMIAIAAIIGLNLLVPEIAYRGYNASHPGDAKYPHGAFFYQQQMARAQIKRHTNMAKDVVGQVGERSVAVLVSWTGYAYVLNELYTCGDDVEHLSLERKNPNVAFERFRVGGRNEVWVVQGIRLEPGSTPAEVASAYLANAIGEGLRVFVPSETASSGFTSEALGADVATY